MIKYFVLKDLTPEIKNELDSTLGQSMLSSSMFSKKFIKK